jgi:hypothetical protein
MSDARVISSLIGLELLTEDSREKSLSSLNSMKAYSEHTNGGTGAHSRTCDYERAMAIQTNCQKFYAALLNRPKESGKATRRETLDSRKAAASGRASPDPSSAAAAAVPASGQGPAAVFRQKSAAGAGLLGDGASSQANAESANALSSSESEEDLSEGDDTEEADLNIFSPRSAAEWKASVAADDNLSVAASVVSQKKPFAESRTPQSQTPRAAPSGSAGRPHTAPAAGLAAHGYSDEEDEEDEDEELFGSARKNNPVLYSHHKAKQAADAAAPAAQAKRKLSEHLVHNFQKQSVEIRNTHPQRLTLSGKADSKMETTKLPDLNKRRQALVSKMDSGKIISAKLLEFVNKVSDVTLPVPVRASRMVEALVLMFGGLWLRARHLALIIESLGSLGKAKQTAHFGTYRVELCVNIFSRIIDPNNFDLVLALMTPFEVGCMYCRIGILNLWNPMKPEGCIVLDLSKADERCVIKQLAVLSAVEVRVTLNGYTTTYAHKPAVVFDP